MNKPAGSPGVWTAAAVVALLVGLLAPLLAPVVPALVIPQFEQTFASFGMDLPRLTRVFIDYPLIAWALLPLVLLTALLWPKPRQRPWMAALIGVLGTFVVSILFFAAMYLPIYRLGSAL